MSMNHFRIFNILEAKAKTAALAVIATAILMIGLPSVSFAIENEDSLPDTVETDPIEVTAADSLQELAAESKKADNQPFFSIDVNDDLPGDILANEEIASEIGDIVDSNHSTYSKKNDVSDCLEESGLYTASPSDGSIVEVTSIFAYQRLVLFAEPENAIDTKGAVNAVYYDGYYLLSYDTQEAAKNAYSSLVSEYGQNSVLIDEPVRIQLYGWGTSYMGMDREKTIASEGDEVTVAVLDTGINSNHKLFNETAILPGYDFVNGDSDPTDDEGHGTSVAGIIAESTPSNVRILPVKVMDEDGSGSLQDLLMGLSYADNQGADISNMSLGGDVDSNVFSTLTRAFEKYRSLMICSSGNESTNMDKSGINIVPAEIPNTLCVGAFDAKGTICSFSNYGSSVDFAAPGKALFLANHSGGVRTGSGTSFSSPYIAAAAALIKAENPGLDNTGVTDALRDKCSDLGPSGYDVYFGSGCPLFPEDTTQSDSVIDISAKGISGQISGIPTEKTYTGKPVTLAPEIIIGGKILTEGTDYILEYQNNINTGTASMDIVGKGNYTGRLKGITFTILPKKITPLLTLSSTSYKFTGKAYTPTVTVKSGNQVLKNGTDYTLTYPAERKNAGKYTVTVKLKGNYSGSGTTSFTIKKAANTLSVRGKTFTVSRKNLSKRSVVSLRSRGLSVSNPKGRVTYTKVSGSGYFSVNKTNGNITARKGTRKGTYRIRVCITALGNTNYAAASRYSYVTINVR